MEGVEGDGSGCPAGREDGERSTGTTRDGGALAGREHGDRSTTVASEYSMMTA